MYCTIAGHNPPGHNPNWARIPCRWQGWMKPPGQNPPVHNVRCSFMLQERGFWKPNFRIGGRKPPDITTWFRTPLSSGFWTRWLCPGGLRPPILKFRFQVGDVWFCGFYTVLPLNGEILTWGVMSSHNTVLCSNPVETYKNRWWRHEQHLVKIAPLARLRLLRGVCRCVVGFVCFFVVNFQILYINYTRVYHYLYFYSKLFNIILFSKF